MPGKSLRRKKLAPQVPNANLCLDQLLSFVNHDVYAPASMLRAYLQAVYASASADEGVREMIADAEGLARELETLLRLLQDRLRLATDKLPINAEEIPLASFLKTWVGTHSGVHWEEAGQEATVLADRQLLGRLLDDATFQMQRMGNRQGTVSVQADGPRLRIWRPDGNLDEVTLETALTAPDGEWSTVLRRLPASGFPLRVAVGLTVGMGGDCTLEREPSGNPVLVLSLPLA
ncbi:MAG: hypothetical protein FJX76_14920 [Armatimonadetes bacterium]|nr:hypothetical protein [Armatimonadota bacterium]